MYITSVRDKNKLNRRDAETPSFFDKILEIRELFKQFLLVSFKFLSVSAVEKSLTRTDIILVTCIEKM
jgi:hypothetical protein